MSQRNLIALAIVVPPVLALVACTPLDDTFSVSRYTESYGMCVGYCVSDVLVNGTEATFTATTVNSEGEDEAHVNIGELTTDGRARLADLTIAADADLDDVYGCPDCNDGGAAELEVVLEGEERVIQYEVGDPPSDLYDADALFTEIHDALYTCTDNWLVTVDSSCVPVDELMSGAR